MQFDQESCQIDGCAIPISAYFSLKLGIVNTHNKVFEMTVGRNGPAVLARLGKIELVRFDLEGNDFLLLEVYLAVISTV